jgi:Ca-activated chloride channel homolog
MKFWLILVVLTALPWGLAAQDPPQQQLPTAPSATKFPPQQTTPQSSATTDTAVPPQSPAPASTSSKPDSQNKGNAGSSPQNNSGSSPSSAQQSSGSTGAGAKDESAKATPPAATATPAGKSGPGDNPDDTLTTIRKRVDEVSVVFTVTDKRGHFVKDLTQSDFRVYDNNKPAESIRSFSRETNLPLRVGLLIDASNSVRDRFKFEQESAIEFLNQIIRRTSDKAFVIGFDTTPEVTQDFTDDTEALSHGVRMLRPGGGTAMYDAIYFACRDKLMQDKSTGPTRRAIILLSDGEDNQSRVSREEAVEMAQRAEVIIYAISTNTSGLKLRGDKVLEHFADETGGKAFFPFKIQDVSNAFSEISDELRSQYDVSYKPADFAPNSQYHKIEILADNKKYKVRARKGYYAPKQ